MKPGQYSDIVRVVDIAPTLAAILGVNGIVIKAHGSSRERAIANALRVAAQEIKHNLNQLLIRRIAHANTALVATSNPVPSANS